MVFDILNAPEFVLNNLFHKFTAKERLRLRLVCKQWNRIVINTANTFWVDLLIHNEDQDISIRSYPVVEYCKLGSEFHCLQSSSSSDVCCHRECIPKPADIAYIHLGYLDDLRSITYPVKIRSLKVANLDHNELYSSQIIALEELISSNAMFRNLDRLQMGLVNMPTRILKSILSALPSCLEQLEMRCSNLEGIDVDSILQKLKRNAIFKNLVILKCPAIENIEKVLFGMLTQRSGGQLWLDTRISTQGFTQFVKEWRHSNPPALFKRITIDADDDLRHHLISVDGVSVTHSTNPFLKLTTRYLPTINHTFVLTTTVSCIHPIEGLDVPLNFSAKTREITVTYAGLKRVAVISKVQYEMARIHPERFELSRANDRQKVKVVMLPNAQDAFFFTRFYCVEINDKTKEHFSWSWFDANTLSTTRFSVSCNYAKDSD
ncbi:hypothetical protein QR680_008186 [Steinernema hermaphroditum]|uniref:F-box domain-containing protein n=1 Tax=Steinernema hermaphroditum TaxID=289476 RepID=A0AA39IH52_9BILA|nr:hypothetical protein QR680_008186 [Steinernema hermaphroditum]